jgi:hypothetical protein
MRSGRKAVRIAARSHAATGALAAVGLAAALSGAGAAAHAQEYPEDDIAEVHDLQQGLPLEVEDTQTAGHRQMALQAYARYERTDSGDDRGEFVPQLQYGFSDRLHAEATYPVFFGSADNSGSQDVQVGAVYRFLDETENLPAMAVKARVDLPTGAHSDGLDTTAVFIASRSLTDEETEDRVHLNLGWEHNMAAENDERANRFFAVIGYSRMLTQETVIAADLIREQQPGEGQDSTILEGGLLHRLTDDVILSAGLGVGIGDDSPDFRATFGMQYSF